MEEFYTVDQAAIALKIHPLTIRRYIKEGKLKAFRVGGSVRISLNDLRLFLQNFIPNPKQAKTSFSTSTKPFSFADPLLSLKGKGLSMDKLEQE